MQLGLGYIAGYQKKLGCDGLVGICSVLMSQHFVTLNLCISLCIHNAYTTTNLSNISVVVIVFDAVVASGDASVKRI